MLYLKKSTIEKEIELITDFIQIDNFFDNAPDVVEYARKQKYYERTNHPDITSNIKKWSGKRTEKLNNEFTDYVMNNLILKCDIEGSEYEIIEDLMLHEKRISMMVFEFHWIDKKKDLFLEKLKPTFLSILKSNLAL